MSIQEALLIQVEYNPLPAHQRKTPSCWTPSSENFNTFDEAVLGAKDFLKKGYFSIEFSEVKIIEDEECERESLDHVEILNFDCAAFDVASETESFCDEMQHTIWHESNRSTAGRYPEEVIEKIETNVLSLELFCEEYDYSEYGQIQSCLDRANKALRMWRE
tara:strand:- start:54 stop:539 length:486 start_codon:yes stop_codon:yes gene_type:complete